MFELIQILKSIKSPRLEKTIPILSRNAKVTNQLTMLLLPLWIKKYYLCHQFLMFPFFPIHDLIFSSLKNDLLHSISAPSVATKTHPNLVH